MRGKVVVRSVRFSRIVVAGKEYLRGPRVQLPKAFVESVIGEEGYAAFAEIGPYFIAALARSPEESVKLARKAVEKLGGK